MKNVKAKKVLITLIRLMFLALFVVLIVNGQMFLWLAVFAVSLVSELVFGRFYCGYICPMNTVMIPTDWLARKLKIQTDKVPAWMKSGRLGWVLLAVSLISMLLLKRLGGINFQILPVLLVLSMIITLRFHPSVFHNLLCPFGAIQKLFSRKPILSHCVDPQACIGCKRCEKVCPSKAIIVTVTDHKAHVCAHLCHQCTNCQQVCPTSAIHYTK
ncbi:MAG: 4Fe-4S binding protein [Saccharofermentanales bacterium]